MRDKLNDPARINLIRDSIANIESFLVGTETCEAFVANRILCHAVIYNLQCIGESVYKLSAEFIDTHTEVDWAAIEGLRHVLVHDYYAVNPERVWAIIKRDLPELRVYIDSL